MENSRLVLKIDAAIRFFLYILIFWLPYSPAVIESCVIISFILWLFKRSIILVTNKFPEVTAKEGAVGILEYFHPKKTFLNKPIGFFLAACILSVTSSAFFAQSLHNFLTKTLEWFVVYFLVVEVFKNKKHIYIVLAIFLFTAFSTVIDSFIQFYITHKDIFLGHVIDSGGRATAGFKTSNSLGGYLTIVIPCLFAWILLGRQKFYYRLMALFILLFMIWSLIITFSRGAWTGAFFGGVFLLFYILFAKKKLKLYFSLGALLVSGLLCAIFLLFLSDNSGQELFSRYETISWRLSVWGNSMEMVKDKFLFGHGINTFMNIFQAYRENSHMGPTYAHNCYIQLAAETGIVGLVCFLWIIAKVFHEPLGKIERNLLQDRNLKVVAIGLLSGIFAFLIHSFFDVNFYSLQLSVYLWFMIGILVAICGISGAKDFSIQK